MPQRAKMINDNLINHLAAATQHFSGACDVPQLLIKYVSDEDNLFHPNT
jgi:hypothetical protein